MTTATEQIKNEFDNLMIELYKTYGEKKADNLYCKVVLKESSVKMQFFGYKCRIFCWYNKQGEKLDDNEFFKFQISALKKLLNK